MTFKTLLVGALALGLLASPAEATTSVTTADGSTFNLPYFASPVSTSTPGGYLPLTGVICFAGCSGGSLGTTNGWTPALANGLSTTAKTIKSSAGQLGVLQCYNPNSTQIYVQVFNTTSPTLGTTTPLLSIPVGPTSTGGLALANPGLNFSAAMSIAATTTATGSTAPTTAPDCNVGFN